MSTKDEDGNGHDSDSLLPRIGEYQVVVVDEQGQVTQSFSLSTRTTFPAIGVAIDLINEEDGTRTAYRVRDVRHPEIESETFSQWRYTGYVAIVQKDNQPIPSTDPPNGRRNEKEPAQSPPVASAKSTKVFDFCGGLFDADSRLFHFFQLIAWAVWEGYREQTQYLESLKFLAWQLQWDGRGWLLRQVTDGRNAAELRDLSRAAKREGEQALLFLERLRSTPAGAIDEVADVISLDTYRNREAK